MATNMLQVKIPKVKRENLSMVAKQLKALARQTKQAASGAARRYARDGRGSAMFFVKHPREQRVVVKVSYTKNTPSRSWAAHGKYLQREHAQIEGKRGLGFDQSSQEIDITSQLHDWQGAGDPRLFKVILSPENANRLDLKQHIRSLMQCVERDLGTALQWVAIDHNNTEHGHVHLLIRGIDAKGDQLTIEPEYIAEGFRHQSQDLVTRKLGLRTEKDICIARAHQIEKTYLTNIDRTLRFKSIGDMVNFETRIPKSALARERRLQEIKRLKFLETMGLAEKVGKKQWRLSPDMEKTLKSLQLSNDIIKSYARHGLGVTNLRGSLVPTEITQGLSLTGKVVGVGLDNELYDRRYLLIEGVDGKVHYILATNSIVKARDNFELKNGEIITLSGETFNSNDGKSISYLRVENHHALSDMIRQPVSRLDDDVIQFVKTNHAAPVESANSSSFTDEYTQAMTSRFVELESLGVFVWAGQSVDLASDYLIRLDNIQHSRFGNFRQWTPVLDPTQADVPVVGTVVASNERKILVSDIRGQYHQFDMSDLALSKPPRVGNEVYLRSNRSPNSELKQAFQKKLCVYKALKKDSLDIDPQKHVLLDRLLNRVGLPQGYHQSMIAQRLMGRAALWKSRGILITSEFEQQAKAWFVSSQTLDQVQKRINKPITIITEKTFRTYQGKVVAMGCYDSSGAAHLILENENSLSALPMTTEKLKNFQLGQNVSLKFKYQQEILFEKSQLQKKHQRMPEEHGNG
jgi:type IV secretory pathway VirD2 relaxase